MQSTTLRVTHNGGRTWTYVSLSDVVTGTRPRTIPEAYSSAVAVEGRSRTAIAQGQGFETCEAPTLDQLREWRWSSPYSAVNLYVGGVLRGCPNAGLNADYLRAAYNIGWVFIPTWVGPQAPDPGYSSEISKDSALAQSQGWAEANAAADLDLPAFPWSDSCRVHSHNAGTLSLTRGDG